MKLSYSMSPVRLRALAALLAAGSLLAGCKSYQVLPGEERHIAEQKRLGLVVDVHRYVGGKELGGNDPQVVEARRRIGAEYLKALRDKGFAVTLLPPDDTVRALVTQYELVHRASWPEAFPANKGKIAGLAPLPGAGGVAENAGVDRILVVTNVYRSFDGSILLAAAATVALGGYAGALWSDAAEEEVCMIDKTGRVVFYDRMGVALRVARELAELPDTVKAEAGQVPSQGGREKVSRACQENAGDRQCR